MRKYFVRLALISAAASAASGCGEPPVITNPAWASTPSAAAMEESYPPFPSLVGLSGRVEMLCLSIVNGILADCRVVRAAPSGIGFENAAVGLTEKFRVAPKTVDGAPKDASVRFVINFRMSEEPAIAPYTGRTPPDGAVRVARQIARTGVPEDLKAMLKRDLRVDADRREAVTAMLARALKATEAEMIEAHALAMARALSPTQAADVANGYRPRGAFPTSAQIEAAGPELKHAAVRTSEVLRAEYCAAYSCGTEFPAE